MQHYTSAFVSAAQPGSDLKPAKRAYWISLRAPASCATNTGFACRRLTIEAPTTRSAFFRLGEFALAESQRVAFAPGFGGLPKKRGIAARLRAFFSERAEAPGDVQLARGIDYACGTYGIDADLPDESYEPIGRAIAGLLADYHAQ